MTEQQAQELAELIRSQLPFRVVTVQQSSDMRNAPSNYFIAIRRLQADLGKMLLIHSTLEWDKALLAWEIIRDS